MSAIIDAWIAGMVRPNPLFINNPAQAMVTGSSIDPCVCMALFTAMGVMMFICEFVPFPQLLEQEGNGRDATDRELITAMQDA